jgi:D-sedoheptulose 7-phosphate isomerase
VSRPPTLPRVDERLRERADANERFFAAAADRIARLCHRMAERFSAGGRLVAFAATPAGRSDARHVAVEFVHPVIVGKRALPALALTGEGGDAAAQVGLACEPGDIALGFGAGIETAMAAARGRGCLTVGFARGCGAEWELVPPTADPSVAQELVETLYHVLWELVHVFFDHPGLLAGRTARVVHDSGASSFLYPFLGQQEHDLEAVVADVRRSVLMKAGDVTALREQTITEGGETLAAAAAVIRAAFDAGGQVLALGNGGSATDAMDLVADLRTPWLGGPPRRALDLTADAAILTAIANDIGTDAIFSRQVIAYGRPGDVLVALSTSGNSLSVVEALAQARRRGLASVAFVGYDGGHVARERLADHVVISRSEHIPRVQEAQATAYHLLRELVERS